METPALTDPRFVAAIDMIGRTGAASWQIRYHDDQQPVVWLAVAMYAGDRWETASGHDPVEAALRLCERVIDGGHCASCGKVTAFLPDVDPAPLVDALCCARQWDPELATFRRACEGDG